MFKTSGGDTAVAPLPIENEKRILFYIERVLAPIKFVAFDHSSFSNLRDWAKTEWNN